MKQDEPEIEIEFAGDGDGRGPRNYRLHVRCFTAWDSECRDLERAEEASSTGALPESIEHGKLAGNGGRGPA